MAAAQKGRKETQTQRKQKTYSRKSQAKQSRKPARKHGKGLQGKKHSRTPYDSKMVRQLQWDKKRLSNKAKGLMISFMNDIYRKVSTEAERLRKQSRRPTIGPFQMQGALQQVMPRKRVRRSATPVSRRCY